MGYSLYTSTHWGLLFLCLCLCIYLRLCSCTCLCHCIRHPVPGYRLMLTGHNLGGGIVSILALQLSLHLLKILHFAALKLGRGKTRLLPLGTTVKMLPVFLNVLARFTSCLLNSSCLTSFYFCKPCANLVVFNSKSKFLGGVDLESKKTELQLINLMHRSNQLCQACKISSTN